jgi:peptide/nickel transport system permease protein
MVVAGQPGTEPLRARRLPVVPWRTVLLYGLTLWAVVTVVFLLPRLLPGDPLRSLEDPTTGQFVYDPQVRAKLAAFYGLNRPLVVQYLSYLSGLAHLRLGWSISQNTPVTTLIARRLPWTLLLMGSALVLSSATSFLAGATAAWHRGGKADRGLIAVLSAASTIPEYAMATVFLVCFAVLVPVFPLSGARTPFAEYSSPVATAGDVGLHLVLPVFALAAGLAANKFLIVRNSVVATLGEDYMLLARAKGLDRRRLKYHHSGRNAMLPFLTALGIQAGFAVGGALFVESVFAYPGMGTLMNAAVTARDYPLLQGSFVVLALVILVANLAVELTYSRFDPRVRR